MKRSANTLQIGKNRQRALWTLVMIALAIPVSGLFAYLGFRGGRGSVSWTMVLFGLLGVVSFAAFGIMVIQTIRSHWHLSLTRSELGLYAPTYELHVPWERVAGIAVSVVNGRPGCVLVFDDVETVARCASFHTRLVRAGSVTGSASVAARMAESFRQRGYHLGIPGQILELGPDALAELLTQARIGRLWDEG